MLPSGDGAAFLGSRRPPAGDVSAGVHYFTGGSSMLDLAVAGAVVALAVLMTSADVPWRIRRRGGRP